MVVVGHEYQVFVWNGQHMWVKEREGEGNSFSQDMKMTALVLCLLKSHVTENINFLQECMKGSPEKARVLYANVEESQEKERLIQACSILGS